MAPPETPSPRRFLPAASSRRQPSPTKSAKPPSRLIQSTTAAREEAPVRVATHAHHLPPPQPHPPPPNESQFAPTPRFSLARYKPSAATQQQRQDVASPPRSSLAHALRPPRVREEVEDAPSSSDLGQEARNLGNDDDDDEEMLLTAEPGEVVRPSIEEFYGDHQQPDDNRPPNPDFSPSSSKRRRLAAPEADPDLLLSPGHKSRTSKATAPQTNTTHPHHHRFAPLSHPMVPNSTSSLPTTTTTTTPSLPRPSFLRPPTPPSAPPLPQSFSPHRRRGAAAFVPGGVASTVQAWVVEAGVQRGGVAGLGRRGGGGGVPSYQTSPQNLPQQQAQSGTWGFRVRVERAEEVLGGSGGWRVWGTRDDGDGSEGGVGDGGKVRCLLVGEGSKGGTGRGVVVGEGAVVGVSKGGLGWVVDVGVDGEGGEADDGIWWVGVGWECGGSGG